MAPAPASWRRSRRRSAVADHAAARDLAAIPEVSTPMSSAMTASLSGPPLDIGLVVANERKANATIASPAATEDGEAADVQS